jgi:hypothetical protein
MKTKGAVKVEVLDPSVKDAAQRIIYGLRVSNWKGDVEAITLIRQLLEGCGAEYPPSEYDWDPEPKFVLLQNLVTNDRFSTLNSKTVDPRVFNGKRIFKIIGYAKTIHEAQLKLYGRVYDN